MLINRLQFPYSNPDQTEKLLVSKIQSILHIKGKGYRPWRPMGDVDARVHIFTATALGWGRVASPTLVRLYPRGNSPVLILGGWVDPRASLDTKKWRKMSTPPTPGIEPGPSSPQLSALPLEPPGPFILHISLRNLQKLKFHVIRDVILPLYAVNVTINNHKK